MFVLDRRAAFHQRFAPASIFLNAAAAQLR
jgi:hypothetical protein